MKHTQRSFRFIVFQSLILYLLFGLALPVCLDAKVPATAVFFSDGTAKEEQLLISRMARTGNRDLLEKQKIQYLLLRMMDSNYRFLRNGEEHSGQAAGSHLRWKYGFARDRISTALEFVAYIGTGSISTGENYFMLVEGEKYPTARVFRNELTRLEKLLDEYIS